MIPGDVSLSPATSAARRIVTELVANGVGHAVIAPGSRSAPLAYALLSAAHAGWLDLHVRIDERVAGFLALGIARATGEPVALLTTSGTAVANLHPAVLEASHAGVPLVVLSADRPHELRHTGANQTTDQVGIFGTACRWFADLPAGDLPPTGLQHLVARAVAAARGDRTRHPGPAHLNIALRDPLVPSQPWRPSRRPDSRLTLTSLTPDTLHPIRRGPRTVIVAGDRAGARASELASRTGWPLVAEPSAELGELSDVPLASTAVLGALIEEVERVIVCGHPTLSRAVTALLNRPDVEVVVLAPTGAQWPDTGGQASVVAHAVEVRDQDPAAQRADEQWAQRWRAAAAAGHAVVTDYARRADDGLMVADVTLNTLGGVRTLVLGSSMTVRDVELLTPRFPGHTRVIANRGLAGIDGTLSTAVGVALAGGGPVRAVVGDLTFLHDAGGLLRGQLEPEVDLDVVVLNDGGGAIFATLEHGRALPSNDFERIFGTPQQVDIPGLAASLGAATVSVTGRDELATALAAPIGGRRVVEVRLDRAALAAHRQVLRSQIAEAARHAFQ